ncbi:hypothetical protein ABT185_07550 [Streptomyces clavifer]|uniref:hypothetical protein n=1 Tax=Streptomyces clavifer TaxID=68188 RepID=UPI00332BDD17
MTTRTHTPDTITTRPDGSTRTEFVLKRTCNGCGTVLGDLDGRDLDSSGNLTDARSECPGCAPLVALEATGCRTWRLTHRNIGDIDDVVDGDGVYAKGYWENVGGKTTVTGLRIGTGETRVVARFGDWVIRHPHGAWSVHEAPRTPAA